MDILYFINDGNESEMFCSSEQKELMKDMYMLFYTDEYTDHIDQSFLEFDISNLNTWLEDQFNNKIGDKWILIDDAAIINYSQTTEYTIIHQSCVLDQSLNNLLIKSICKKSSNKPIIFVSRIQAMIGPICIFHEKRNECKVTEIRISDYPSTHYVGIEMPIETIQRINIS